MKRWLWLLAVPYVVTVEHPCTKFSDVDLLMGSGPICLANDATSYAITPLGMAWESEEIANDMAFALNEAHERRIKEDHIFDGVPLQ